MISGAEREANLLREKIINSKSNINNQLRCYYISSDGDDSFDGTSPEFPIKSLERASYLPLCSGDCLLFKRGDVFRVKNMFRLQGGVSYGSYGEGDKPKLYGSLRDYADKSIWKNTSENIWELTLPYSEAGVVTMNYDAVVGFRKMTYEEIKVNGDYFHNIEQKKLFLFCDSGNPGEYYKNIEIGTMPEILYVQNVNYVSIDNLCMKYASKFAINLGNNNKINISNCEIAWIGGAIARENIRYGNGIQFWYRAFCVKVENCWIYQNYDAAITFQGCGPENTIFENVTFENNLIEKCSMNIECWARDQGDKKSRIRNIYIQNNIIRLGGYGWAGTQRTDIGDQALFLTWNDFHEDLSNYNVINNIFDCCDGSLIWALPPSKQHGLTVKNNTYYQSKTSGRNPYDEVIRKTDLHANDQKTLECAIGYFDDSPKLVKWVQETK